MLISLVTAIDSLALSTFLYLLFAFRDHRRRRGSPYPPGPPSWPIIGNLLDVPKLSPWFLKYGKIDLSSCCDVICLQVFGQAVVVLCSPTAIKDLLERRGELYADRMPFPIFEPELMGVEWFLPHSRLGKYWREGRKLLDRSFRPSAIALHRGLIEEKTRVFLGQLLATPNAFREHIELLQGKIVMRLTYGYDLKDNDDMLVPPRGVVNITKQFMLPGAALVNDLPFLRHLPSWVPWFKYEPLVSQCRELAWRTKNEPFDFVRNSMRAGTAVPSLATEYLQEADLLSDLDSQPRMQDIKDLLGSLFIAGSDTTTAAMYSLFLALILYPEVQKRAQAELDAVSSRDRLPTYDDKPRLPYIEAMSKELMRWQMVTPLGPHATTDDDFYRGYFIPKGAAVITNGWAVLHNPELYPDPEAFNPDRFLNEDGTFRDDPMIPLAFGAGRRICPARHFVDTTLFIVTASVLSVFNVTKAKDKDGNDIPVAVPPLESILPDIAIQLPKFGCSITPRDKVAEDLIRASALA
ncbi:cytochrome P450 [Lactarius akahatsu]|uniref:Cytochrome P450 n=1 Tax=Lactarius akahatsu TaxID=416441 RepID=A0AAD4LN45_9AGAM|nr:cytochrome P450 [Lactarius akahatsu]